jgi:peptide deformylase
MSSTESQKSILKLNLEGNPILRHKFPNTDITQDLEWDQISALMHRTMISANGIGLAANQVNVGLRMFVLNLDAKTFINPEIIESSKELQTKEEGCLSFPNLFFTVTRPKTILVKYHDEKLDEKVDRFEDIWAQCIQHEIDHLNGVLFIDYASKFKLDRARKKQRQANDTSR